MARARAPSLPGRTWSQRSAFSATFVLRGSMTISLAPRALAWLMRTAAAGHDTWGFVPQSKMQRA